MIPSRVVIDRLYNRKRVDITPQNYLPRFKRHIALTLILSTLITALFLFQYGIDFITLGLSIGFFVLTMVVAVYFKKRTKSVAVKGDTLILNSFNKQSCVTSLRSIKKVHTNTFMGVQWTQMSYNLDGVTRSMIMINRSWAVSSTPEKLIKKAIQLSKRKKANHKPGPVSVE